MATKTFHKFGLLPLELRTQIWEMTIEPRTVQVRLTKLNPRNHLEDRWALTSSTSVPGLLQTCREARNLGLYKQELSTGNKNTKLRSRHRRAQPRRRIQSPKQMGYGDEPVRREKEGEQGGGVERYVWLNLEIDMIDIGRYVDKEGGTRLESLELHAAGIKRFKFERENTCEWWYHFESNCLRSFVNVKEIHVVCADGIWNWCGATEEHCWHCGVENLYFIDPVENDPDGRLMTATEAEDEVDRVVEKNWAADTGEYIRMVRWNPVPLDHEVSCDCHACADGRYHAAHDPLWLLGFGKRDAAMRKAMLEKFGDFMAESDDGVAYNRHSNTHA
jgi:hypothetical protein